MREEPIKPLPLLERLEKARDIAARRLKEIDEAIVMLEKRPDINELFFVIRRLGI